MLRRSVNKPLAPKAPSVGTRIAPSSVPPKKARGTMTPGATTSVLRPATYVPNRNAPRNTAAGAAGDPRTPTTVANPVRNTPAPPKPPLPANVLDFAKWSAWHAAQKGGAPFKTDEDRRDAYWQYRASRGAPVPGAPVVQTSAGTGTGAKTAVPKLTLDPSVLDFQGESDVSELKDQLRLSTGLDPVWDTATNSWTMNQLAGDADKDGIPDGGALNQALASQIRAIALSRLQNNQTADEGMVGADRNAAARGMFNSGIRSMNRERVNSRLRQALAALASQESDARATYDTNWQAAVNAFRTGSRNASINSYGRRWPQYLTTMGS